VKKRTDVLTKEQRSKCMSNIKGKDTSIEVALRSQLWCRGLRFRKHYKIIGRPDIVFVSARVAVFIDGCFWHRCPAHFIQPKNNDVFWLNKISRNVARDELVNAELKTMGWNVLRFWEHELEDNLNKVASSIEKTVQKRILRLGGGPERGPGIAAKPRI